ncbi:hypothetical protein, partial [Tannerella forsythia]
PTLRFAPHWAELMRPFRAFTTVSKQINNSTPQQSNTSTIEHLNNRTPQRPEGVSPPEAHGRTPLRLPVSPTLHTGLNVPLQGCYSGQQTDQQLNTSTNN